MKYVTLNNGVKMPILGFGVFQVDEKDCERCVYDALMAGYRHIDTAALYKNEKAVGRAIKKSGIPREELFIVSKVWVQDFGYENTKKAFMTSLNNLDLEYIDLYLVHQGFGDYYGTWRALEEFYHEGKIRAIGVSNFEKERMVDFLINQKTVPVINQIELHPLFQQKEARKILKENNIQVESWGPLVEGRNNIFQNELLTKIGKKYGKSVAQVMIRWQVQSDIVVIPKSVHKERIQENFDIWDFELSPEDMKAIDDMDTGKCVLLDNHDPEIAKLVNNIKIHD